MDNGAHIFRVPDKHYSIHELAYAESGCSLMLDLCRRSGYVVFSVQGPGIQGFPSLSEADGLSWEITFLIYLCLLHTESKFVFGNYPCSLITKCSYNFRQWLSLRGLSCQVFFASTCRFVLEMSQHPYSSTPWINPDYVNLNTSIHREVHNSGVASRGKDI